MRLLSKKNYFLFFLMLVFVFIATSALAISGNFLEKKVEKSVLSSSVKNFPPNPVLKENSGFPLISAQGAIAVDLGSGAPLYEKNPDLVLLPASTTKIVTALVAMDTFSLDQVLTVPKGVGVDGQKMNLYAGEKMRVSDLLYGLLIFSANDAAMTLAMNYPVASDSGIKPYDAFILAMNDKAVKLSMNNSHFENPVGLDGPTQTTTARDLVRVSEVAMRSPIFSEIVGKKTATVTDITGKSSYRLENVNELLGIVPGVLGIKTGWTENARENLVTYIEREGQDGASHKVIIAILGSQDRFGETKELIDWIFSSYEWQEVNLTTVIDNNLR